ncbi:MAG: Gfo/Idh/MocA family oxidoreductase, partial [Chthoniobacterales bacterium]
MKTYAICGLSSRAIGNFVLPLLGNPKLPEYGDYRAHGKIVAVLDMDPERVATFNRNQGTSFAYYAADQFDKMVSETKPDVIIVTTPDGQHAQYIVAALKHNLEVITEKPMVIDGKQAQEVMEAERNSKGHVRVAHNYRYTPLHMGIKKLIMSGRLGKIVHAQMIYQLDTFHGSSYFARWNREREMSGGLTITKGCHHFDLLNWWLNDEPDEVFAYGARNYYGANSPHDPAFLDGKEYNTAEKWER